MYICIYSGKKEPSTSLFLVYVFYFISGPCMVFFFVPLDYTGRVGLLIQSMELFSHVYVSFHIFSRAKDDYVPFINGRLYLICIGFYLCKILLDDTECETPFLVLSWTKFYIPKPNLNLKISSLKHKIIIFITIWLNMSWNPPKIFKWAWPNGC